MHVVTVPEVRNTRPPSNGTDNKNPSRESRSGLAHTPDGTRATSAAATTTTKQAAGTQSPHLTNSVSS